MSSSRGAPPFPVKLYDMLEDAERYGFCQIISWLPNGIGFRIHKPDDLVKQLLPRYFEKQRKYKSFQRQLHMYEFKVLGRGAPRGSQRAHYNKGVFFHPFFVRGDRESSSTMVLRRSITMHHAGRRRSPEQFRSSNTPATSRGQLGTVPEVYCLMGGDQPKSSSITTRTSSGGSRTASSATTSSGGVVANTTSSAILSPIKVLSESDCLPFPEINGEGATTTAEEDPNDRSWIGVFLAIFGSSSNKTNGDGGY